MCAACVTVSPPERYRQVDGLQHPLDLAKVRMQTASARVGMLQTLKNVFFKEGIPLCNSFNLTATGFFALYNGLSASLLRQATYSTVRFGVYEELKEYYQGPGKPLSLGQLILMASASGWCLPHNETSTPNGIGSVAQSATLRTS